MGAGRGQALSSTEGQFGGGLPSESQDVRLTEQERKLVAKLLSDPTYFPVEFRAWLKNYIESAGITIGYSQIVGTPGGGSGTKTSLPPGLIVIHAGGTLSSDVVACDGTAYSRVTYKALYDVIGTTWGAGDGSTTFNVPDLRDRAIYGAGTVVGLGATDGVANGSRGGPSHHHGTNREVVSLSPGGTPYNIVGGAVIPGPDTTGGYAQDKPSHAGAIYAITTGL